MHKVTKCVEKNKVSLEFWIKKRTKVRSCVIMLVNAYINLQGHILQLIRKIWLLQKCNLKVF